MKKRVIVLGATGSIGTSAIGVIEAHPDCLELVGLSAHSDYQSFARIASRFPHAKTAFSSDISQPFNFTYTGKNAIRDLIQYTDADIVLHGIAGSAGLDPSLAVIERGMDLALANKETIVMAGELVLSEARKKGISLIPVDSEHSAIFHLLRAHGAANCEEILLTASGGPFRNYTADALQNVTLEDALAHPTWQMGPKISIDSATLANKGLELIEAVRLFSMDSDRVKVLVHPQSKVHSLIRLQDGSMYAQISDPDMRVPIHNALFYPDCAENEFGRLDLAGMTLEFFEPDTTRFPMLSIAREAARLGNQYPVAYNAANEVAVAAFMQQAIRFVDIPALCQEVMSENWTNPCDTIEHVWESDARARRSASKIVHNRGAHH